MKSSRVVRRLILNELPISGLSITSLMLTAETESLFHGGLRPEGTELSGSLGARMKLDSSGRLEQRQPSAIPKYLSRKNSPLGERSGSRRGARVLAHCPAPARTRRASKQKIATEFVSYSVSGTKGLLE